MDREKERKAARGYSISMSIMALAFSIFWCVAVAAMGAWFMLLFGIPFVGLTAYRLVMGIKLSKERTREKDPWEQPRQRASCTEPTYAAPTCSASNCEEQRPQGGFCPYCGSEVTDKFTFCPGCGRRL